MMNKLSGQPDSYDKKYVESWPLSLRIYSSDSRAQYRFGRTLGAGTYGIVREAECGGERFAIKIILKKNVKGNEKMVYDEMVLLQRMKHPNIVRFHDWFESKVILSIRRCCFQELTMPCWTLGQILHRDSTSYWRRAFRPHLRVWEIYGKGRLANHTTSSRSCRLPTLQ